MSDEVDLANDAVQNRLDGAIAMQRAALHRQGTPECEDCGDDIPLDRRAVYPAATRCVACQGRRETLNRQGVRA
ncbi:TraR/DksA C4-type zinc finger protein [Chitinimonas koreensis]|uniref:TraR/DksA C4-type zinc finger protein n=1 Tax=Chitinimonas koreensis TaxID=356302 RepID=UPI00041983F2|nr:TraR/DksA C4-type zinc finger protein [Chitinimonas koreensis]